MKNIAAFNSALTLIQARLADLDQFASDSSDYARDCQRVPQTMEATDVAQMESLLAALTAATDALNITGTIGKDV